MFKDLNAEAASLGREALPVGPWANYRTALSLNVFSLKPRSVSDDPFLFKGSGINFGLLTFSVLSRSMEAYAKYSFRAEPGEQTPGAVDGPVLQPTISDFKHLSSLNLFEPGSCPM